MEESVQAIIIIRRSPVTGNWRPYVAVKGEFRQLTAHEMSTPEGALELLTSGIEHAISRAVKNKNRSKK